MAQEFVFRFLSVRPADSTKKIEQRPEKSDLYPAGKRTDFGDSLDRASQSPNGAAVLARLVRSFRDSAAYVGDLADLALDLSPGLDWVQLNMGALADDPTSRSAIEAHLPQPIEKVVASADFKTARLRLADTLYAEASAVTPEGLSLDALTVAQKFLGLLADYAAGTSFGIDVTVGQVVGARTLLLARQRITAPKPPVEPKPPARVTPPADPGAKTRDTLDRLVAAHREIVDLAGSPQALTVTRVPAAVQAERAVRGETAQRTARSAAGGVVDAHVASGALRLTSAAAATLSQRTQSQLKDLRVDPSRLDPMGAVRLLERKIWETAGQLASNQQLSVEVRIGSVNVDIGKLGASLGANGGTTTPVPALAHLCTYQAGIGDLLIVRQTLKAYELAEIASTENVLAGETRSREHRRLDTSEDITSTTTTTETEKEKDLQSTQRNEMQTQADKVVQQQFGLEAGVQVSGSYGPSVQFATHLNVNFSTSSQETQKKSVSFSQEVTNKTSERVRQQVSQTVTRRVLQEIQEINLHAFTNKSDDKHIRGIYRWLNKVYDAQIYNYGQRMMYEFVIPEPAAFYLYAMVGNPPSDATTVKPDAPTFAGAPLKPANLTATNYHDYVAKYQVTAVTPPPPAFTSVAFFDKQEGGSDAADYARSNKIGIPDGYEAFGATVSTDFVFKDNGDKHTYRIMIGGNGIDASGYWGAAYVNIQPTSGELAIAYNLLHVVCFTLGIDVACRATAAATAKWQQQAFDAIVQAYQKLKADYDEKIAEQKLAQEDAARLGRNPAENTRVTQDELKKLVLMVLTGTDYISRDSYWPFPDQEMRLDKVCENGSWIRFFENAFEWTNLTYVLYPYFWGRRARWITALQLTDPDTDFSAFLRAGAARVQVPVRPGFEKAVAHYCQFGEIWDGNDPPLRDDDLYVPIVDEIAANLGKFTSDGVVYPDGAQPWEVRIPTELVLVQNIDEVPSIRDMMTGNPVTIHS